VNREFLSIWEQNRKWEYLFESGFRYLDCSFECVYVGLCIILGLYSTCRVLYSFIARKLTKNVAYGPIPVRLAYHLHIAQALIMPNAECLL